MTAENPTQHPEEEPILTLIQKIKDDLFDPRLLSKEQRQQCVEVLNGEGLTEVTIAQILKVSTKTISRDLLAIQERSALTPNINLVKQIIGELVRKAHIHHAYLMRLARSRDATPGEKAQAEFMAWRILNELVVRLESTGYIPSSPKQIVGDLYHHLADDSEKSLEEIKKMVIEIEAVSIETEEKSPEVEEELKSLKAKITKAEIAYQADKLSQKQKDLNQKKEESDDK
jgi:hypothetical protein